MGSAHVPDGFTAWQLIIAAIELGVITLILGDIPATITAVNWLGLAIVALALTSLPFYLWFKGIHAEGGRQRCTVLPSHPDRGLRAAGCDCEGNRADAHAVHRRGFSDRWAHPEHLCRSQDNGQRPGTGVRITGTRGHRLTRRRGAAEVPPHISTMCLIALSDLRGHTRRDYAANLGIGVSTNRMNRWLRAPTFSFPPSSPYCIR